MKSKDNIIFEGGAVPQVLEYHVTFPTKTLEVLRAETDQGMLDVHCPSIINHLANRKAGHENMAREMKRRKQNISPWRSRDMEQMQPILNEDKKEIDIVNDEFDQ